MTAPQAAGVIHSDFEKGEQGDRERFKVRLRV
jgi:ribosome-binding ATPase YchF (GTP1/OBG family)